MTEPRYRTAIAAFDKANAEDPNTESCLDRNFPKELLYALRMGEMQERYAPEASEAVRLAVRAQHIQRWKIPRKDFPMDRQGYLQWRTRLYKFHAETAGDLMREAGYDDEMIERVMTIVSKKGLKVNPLGVKGAGEAGAIGAPAAVVNAISDALSPFGVAFYEMPVTPQRIRAALRKASRRMTRVSP